ncbi:hypothetical protein ES703_90329 [subsurface metagenome]
MVKGSLVGPLPGVPKEDDLLYKIKELINEAVSDAFDQFQFDNPSEVYELVEQYFKKDESAANLIRPLVIPIINFGPARLRRAIIKSLDTTHYHCRLLARDGSTELGSADIAVYPVEHLGTGNGGIGNDLSGTDVWPDEAVNDYLSVYFDVDGVWRTPIVVDDTTTCA